MGPGGPSLACGERAVGGSLGGPCAAPGAGLSARAGSRSPDPSCRGALALQLSTLGVGRQPSVRQWSFPLPPVQAGLPPAPSSTPASWSSPGVKRCVEEEGQGCCAPAPAESPGKRLRGTRLGERLPFLATRRTGCRTCLCPQVTQVTFLACLGAGIRVLSQLGPPAPPPEANHGYGNSSGSTRESPRSLSARHKEGKRTQERSESRLDEDGRRGEGPHRPEGGHRPRCLSSLCPEQTLHQEAASCVSLGPGLPSVHINT